MNGGGGPWGSFLENTGSLTSAKLYSKIQMYKVELNHLKHIRYVWFLDIFISEF